LKPVGQTNQPGNLDQGSSKSQIEFVESLIEVKVAKPALPSAARPATGDPRRELGVEPGRLSRQVQVEEGAMKYEAACTAIAVIATSAIMVGAALAQGTGGASPGAVGPPATTSQAPTTVQPPSVVEPPRTTGQAPTSIPSSSHRQPRAKDVPSDEAADREASKAANQEIDRKLNICRGC
jgi:hypothetical protein